MKIIQTLAAWALYSWPASAQEASDACASVTVTHVSQELPCATVGTLYIDPNLSGTLELDSIIRVEKLYIFDNNGLVNLSSTSLSRIDGGLSIDGVPSLADIRLPNLTDIRGFSIIDAPNLRQIWMSNDTITAEGFYIINTAISNIFHRLDSVQFLTLSNNSRLDSFSSQIRSIVNGKFDFNNELSLKLPKLVSAELLYISHSAEIDLGSLESINSSFTLKDNVLRSLHNDLSPLQLPNLETIGEDLTVVQNNDLVELNFPQLKTVGGSLAITNNSATVKANFPQLNKIGEDLTVTGNPAITELDGFPELSDVSDSVVLGGDFKYVELPNLSNAAGGLWVSSSEDINYSCARLNTSFQSNRPHQSFECRSAGDEWGSDGDNTTGGDSRDTNPGQNQDGEQMAPAQPLSGGAIAGIVIGALAAVGILAAVLFIVRRRRRKGAGVEESSSTTEAGGVQDPKYTPVPPGELQGVPRSELAMPDPELEGSNVPKDGGTIYYEVDGNSRRGV